MTEIEKLAKAIEDLTAEVKALKEKLGPLNNGGGAIHYHYGQYPQPYVTWSGGGSWVGGGGGVS